MTIRNVSSGNTRKKIIAWADAQQARERGFVPSFHKPLSMILVYPNSYHIAMSNLGFQSIYYYANQHPVLFCDRGFVNDQNQPIIGILSKQPLRSFDIVAFSVSYELDYFNIISGLIVSGLNPYYEKREDSDPLVVIGGIATTINPRPLAKIADLFVIGDGEEMIGTLITRYADRKTRSGFDVLESLSSIEGVYSPRIHDFITNTKIKRQVTADLDRFGAQSVVLTPDTEFPDRFLIEVGRGCGRRCRFCAADYIYPRVYMQDADKILEEIDHIRPLTDKVGLLGVAVTSHPQIKKILQQLRLWNMEASISSLRLESLDEPVVQMIIESGQRSLTIAPETGSDSLRAFLNKRFSNEMILEKIRLFVQAGLKELKLYFMIGIPGETESDVAQIGTLISDIASSGLKIKANINQFIPKPHTPLAFEKMDSQQMLKKKFRTIQESVRKVSRLDLSFASVRGSYLEALLCRADAELGEKILVQKNYSIPKEIPAIIGKSGEVPWTIIEI